MRARAGRRAPVRRPRAPRAWKRRRASSGERLPCRRMQRRPVLLLVALLALVCAAGAAGASASIDWSMLGPLQSGPPPWGNDSNTLSRRLPAIGLHALGQEGAALHI